MIRQTIDEYLDGALDNASRAEVERTVASDPVTARMLSQAKAERTVRQAVYASYAPSAAEASALAEKVLDAASAPVGHIGIHRWIRITAGVAAGIVIAAGAFGLGRVTAPAQIVTRESPTFYTADRERNNLEVRHFNSNADAQNYLSQIDPDNSNGPVPVKMADYTKPNRF